MRFLRRMFSGSNRDTAIRRLALTGVVISATVLSYSTLHHHAVVNGIPEWSAWFYPILFDTFILAASRMWQSVELRDKTRRLARNATLFTIVAAIGVFVAEFYPRGFIAAASALMIPAVLATSLVLMSRSAADRNAGSETPADEPEEAEEVLVPVEAPEPVAAKLEGSTQPVEMSAPEDGRSYNTQTITFKGLPTVSYQPVDKREWVHAQLDAGVEVTGAMIRERYPEVKNNGSRLLKSVQTERSKRNGHSVVKV